MKKLKSDWLIEMLLLIQEHVLLGEIMIHFRPTLLSHRGYSTLKRQLEARTINVSLI